VAYRSAAVQQLVSSSRGKPTLSGQHEDDAVDPKDKLITLTLCIAAKSLEHCSHHFMRLRAGSLAIDRFTITADRNDPVLGRVYPRQKSGVVPMDLASRAKK
jgi:hypothetical protein